MWRHRFVFDRWGWELPGGLVEAGEDPMVTAAREVEEETGYRPKNVERLVSSADGRHGGCGAPAVRGARGRAGGLA
ncbi:NUDIX domain-containing protein [Nonomuraea jabiensis]|uniref:NUDIX domain-containing protein n=1 Tax=Nonomuraea jabiensis TaxID=882448 RepID=UPI0028B0B336|nr:NUDIX domain-containing protein [Nonomuraea jabiensis]